MELVMNNNNYNYSKNNKCCDCKKKISNNCSRCRSCADKQHSKRMSKEGNSNFIYVIE